MGEMLRYRCPKCGFFFRFLEGCGMFYPFYYEEAVEEMKSGKRGKILQKFFEEHPDGAVDINHAIMQCNQCKNYSTQEALTMCIPKTGYIHTEKFFDFNEISENYIEYVKYPHKCSDCGGELKILDEDSVKLCPICGTELQEKLVGCWD